MPPAASANWNASASVEQPLQPAVLEAPELVRGRSRPQLQHRVAAAATPLALLTLVMLALLLVSLVLRRRRPPVLQQHVPKAPISGEEVTIYDSAPPGYSTFGEPTWHTSRDAVRDQAQR